MSLRTILSILLVLVLTRCGSPAAPTVDEALGEWEKPDSLLPPINLLLTRNGSRVDARLRLSGIEANGIAVFSDRQLRLTFPGRPDVVGEFISKDELKLRLDAAGPEYVLKKRK
jgi:hypothetical protein